MSWLWPKQTRGFIILRGLIWSTVFIVLLFGYESYIEQTSMPADYILVMIICALLGGQLWSWLTWKLSKKLGAKT